MPEWLTILIAVGSGLVGGGAAWGVLTARVSRLERDVEVRATVERVAALEKMVEQRHDGLEKKLDRIEDTLEQIRAELHRARENTNPGR